MKRMVTTLQVFSLCLLIAACGTDTGSGKHRDTDTGGTSTRGVTVTTSNGSTSDRAGFSLRLTDAPIDNLAKVVVSFTAVQVRLKKGGWTKYTLAKPQPIDLLSLQGLTTANLLENMPIEPGEYKQIKFYVDTTPMANHVEMLGGGVQQLVISNGETNGLKVKQNFTIPEDRLMNFTVDFDLRKAVKYKKSLDEYRLKSKMRLVIDENTGVIRGTVAPLKLVDPSCSDADVDTHNSVYVYAGHDAVTGDLDDSSSANDEPLSTTKIKYDNESGLYVYEAAFLPLGDYTLAFTCNADLDDNDADDILPFFHVQNVSVLVNDKTFLKP